MMVPDISATCLPYMELQHMLRSSVIELKLLGLVSLLEKIGGRAFTSTRVEAVFTASCFFSKVENTHS